MCQPTLGPVQHSIASISLRPKNFVFSQRLKDSAYGRFVYRASLAEYSSAIFNFAVHPAQTFIQQVHIFLCVVSLTIPSRYVLANLV